MLMSSTRRISLLVPLCVIAAVGVGSAQRASGQVSEHDGVHAALLIANRTAAKHQLELPASVAKALKDAGELLPFTYYELVDQAFLRGAGNRIRLTGSTGRSYSLAVTARPRRDSADRLAVHVVLSETWSSPKGDPSDVMITEYTARLGETVVVGTSKMGGDDSLVLLVTLLPFQK
jgi:hypothetical protein